MSDFDLEYLASLPKPEAIEEIDYETILAALKVDLAARAPAYGFNLDTINLDNNPIAILLQAGAAEETILRARGNDIVRSWYLYFARSGEVEHIGAFYDVVRIPNETDDRFKERIILAIQGRSTGGTKARYSYVAMSADLRVAGVEIYRDGLDPTVNVAVFATDNNGVADQDLLDAVTAALNAEDVVMVNDTIAVRSAVVQIVNVTAAVKLLPQTSSTLLTDIAAGLAEQWIAESGLGRDLTLDWLTKQIMQPGVYDVTFTAPSADTVMAPYEACRIGTVTLTEAGRNY